MKSFKIDDFNILMDDKLYTSAIIVFSIAFSTVYLSAIIYTSCGL